eukprot:5590693-Pleurochrysis_carterae.AAC.7
MQQEYQQCHWQCMNSVIKGTVVACACRVQLGKLFSLSSPGLQKPFAKAIRKSHLRTLCRQATALASLAPVSVYACLQSP